MITNILQPFSVEPNTPFTVKIVLNRDNTWDEPWGEAYGFVGILLPDGWMVKDSVPYRTTLLDQKSFLMYDPYIVELLYSRKTIAVPDHYHWWGAKSLDIIDMNYLDTVFASVTIVSGAKTGPFGIRYVFGDNSWWYDGDYEITVESQFIPIRVDTTSHSETSRKNEEWELFPNPSTGQVYIRQGSVSGEVKMQVYDMNGRLQKSDILWENLTKVDLRTLSKGTYIVSLENRGEVRTKRLVIQ